MNLRSLDLKPRYSSRETDLLQELWIPVLSNSIIYRRGVGYFRSDHLASAARGLTAFMEHDGKAQLICGVEFTSRDIEAISRGYSDRAHLVEEKVQNEITSSHSTYHTNSIGLLAWMVKNGTLDIKIATKKDGGSGIFHSKFGICYDNLGNKVVFEGSANETAGGLINNRESISLDTSWHEDPWIRERIRAIEDDFNRLWENNDPEYWVMEFPEAARKELLKIAPSEKPTKEPLQELIQEGKEHLAEKKVVLRSYQEKAVESWIANGGRGMMEMATGSGKTYTAIAGISALENEFNIENLCIIVTCPYTHLVLQWQKSLEDFGYHSTAVYGGVSNWKDRAENAVLRLNGKIENRLIFVTTHDTFSGDQFMWLVRQIQHPILLIADEVHAVGSEIRRQGLLDEYTYRLGLSATPRRYFDEEGTDYIFNFFGSTVAQFTLGDAIEQRYLVPYIYHTVYATLNQDELEQYRKLTRKIATQMSIADKKGGEEELLTLFQIQRQKIIVNASEKLPKLKEILVKIADNLDHCLIYCSDSQIDDVQRILNKLGIIHQRVTFRESTATRNDYFRKFDEGIYKVIVAINVLDEGVDIPSIKMAIIMASTGNPKQYIQRRGRVLRTYPGKEKAEIYDMVVLPPLGSPDSNELFSMERAILIKELKRHEEMAILSINRSDALSEIENIKKRHGVS